MAVSDTEIIAEIHRDTENGFRILVSQYTERIYWHIRRIVLSHQDAQDITQETFVRIFRSISQLRHMTSLKSWIYQIATNEALRAMDKYKPTEILGTDTEHLQADSFIDYSDIEAVDLKRAINTLPPKQRVIFNLRYYDSLEYDEIANILNSNVHNIRANYHVSKERIVRYIKAIH